MEFKTEELHKRAMELARRFHETESALIDILQQLDDERIFIKLGYSSLFDYAVKALKLSEANASNFITVARKSKSVPELKMAIAAGEITVSKARKITSVLTSTNSSHWIELAKTLPKQKLEKEVAKIAPHTLTPEKAKYVTENRIELKMGLSEEIMKKLRRAQDLVSQKSKAAATLEQTLMELLDLYLKRQDPVIKAERNLAKPPSKTATSYDAPASVPETRYISAEIKHQVNLRDQGRCSHIYTNGAKCENRRWVEIHHTKPLSYGGTNDLDNLTTLCQGHHKQRHLMEH